MKRILQICALLFVLSAGPAFAQCDNLPTDAQNYLRAHSGWKLLQVQDISDPDDRKAWLKNKPGLCPGFAELDLDGSHRPSHALALLQTRGEKTYEQVVLLWHDGKPRPVQTLVEPFAIGPRLVIWRLEPGVYSEWDTRKKTRITHDSLGFEEMEAHVTLYYFSKGKFHTLTTSN